MVLVHIEIIMQVSSIALVTGAAGFWTGTGLDMRPKRIDEQTLIGGTIWSQIIIPIGLLLSEVVEESLDPLVKCYYLVTGVLLLWMTGIVLMLHETKRFRIEQRRINALELRVDSWSTQTSVESLNAQKPGVVSKSQQTAYVPMKIKFHYDKAYYTIGVMCFVAGAVKMLEFVMFVILNLKTLTFNK